MPLDVALKAAPLGVGDHIHLLGNLELLGKNPVAGVELGVLGAGQAKLPQEARRLNAGLLEVALHRTLHMFRLDELDVTQLHGVIAVLGSGLTLQNHARAGPERRDGHDPPGSVEDLRHPDLFS